MQPFAIPKTLLKSKDWASEFNFLYRIQWRKPEGLETLWNRDCKVHSTHEVGYSDGGADSRSRETWWIYSQTMANAHFIKIKSRLPPRSCDSQKCSDTEVEPGTDTSLVPLFSSPDEGCVKEYLGFSSLKHYLDLGKHKRALEQGSARLHR